MIQLDCATLREPHGRRAILSRASFRFTPGIWHIDADPAGDARLLIRFLACCRDVDENGIGWAGSRSWPLAQFSLFGPYLSGLDTIDALCDLYALERRGTFGLFRVLLDDADWLRIRFDRWPPMLQRQFGHIAFVAPVFDNYFLDISPLLLGDDFRRRWLPLLCARLAGKTTLIASAGHRAVLRELPGQHLTLTKAHLRSRTHSEAGQAMAAE